MFIEGRGNLSEDLKKLKITEVKLEDFNSISGNFLHIYFKIDDNLYYFNFKKLKRGCVFITIYHRYKFDCSFCKSQFAICSELTKSAEELFTVVMETPTFRLRWLSLKNKLGPFVFENEM